MKKQKKLAAIILVIMIMLVCTGCVVKMPVPEVTEGRFDFSVTYEMNGEEKTYSGVYVCKYNGVYVTLAGRGRNWNGYIENSDGATYIVVGTVDDYEICIDLGFYPDYFMADPDYIDEKPQPYIFVCSVDEEAGEITLLKDEEEIFTNYGVKLISYNYAEPIKNSYKEKVTSGSFEPSIN